MAVKLFDPEKFESDPTADRCDYCGDTWEQSELFTCDACGHTVCLGCLPTRDKECPAEFCEECE